MPGPPSGVPEEGKRRAVERFISMVAHGQSQRQAGDELGAEYGVAWRTIRDWTAARNPAGLAQATDSAARERTQRAREVLATFSLENQRWATKELGVELQRRIHQIVRRNKIASTSELAACALILQRLGAIDKELDYRGVPQQEPEAAPTPAPESEHTAPQLVSRVDNLVQFLHQKPS